MHWWSALRAAAAALVLASTAAFAQQAVTIADLAKNPDGFVGKKVTIAECLVTSYHALIGVQCSPVPLNPDFLVYVDVETMSAAAKQVGSNCNTTDINNFCVVKVVGEVAKDRRGKALVKNAAMDIVRRGKAF